MSDEPLRRTDQLGCYPPTNADDDAEDASVQDVVHFSCSALFFVVVVVIVIIIIIIVIIIIINFSFSYFVIFLFCCCCCCFPFFLVNVEMATITN